MDAAGRMIAVIIAVVMVVLQPLPYIAQLQAESADHIVKTMTQEFADTARYQGYVTKEMYEAYGEKLTQTGDRYNVEMKVSTPVNGKELASKAKENILTAAVDHASRAKSMLLSSAVSHVHTDACYAGHRHTEACKKYSYATDKEVLVYTYSSYGGYSGYNSLARGVIIRCRQCNSNLYKLFYSRVYDSGGSTVSGSLEIRNFITGEVYSCTSNNDYNAFNSNWYSIYAIWYKLINELGECQYSDTTSQKETLPSSYFKYYGVWDQGIPVIGYKGCLNCGTQITYVCGQPQDETPICDRVVTSITATQPTQEVIAGNDITATATATYLDGHTGMVNCSISGYDKNKIGTQTATLTYSGLVDNAKTTGSKSCKVIVTVKDNKKLISIGVTPVKQSMKRYENPALIVTAAYSDGSSKAVTGYTISGFNNAVLGTQTAMISYTEHDITKTAVIQITVTRLTAVCPVCGAIYELDEKDVDNGCPVCAGTITGLVASPSEITVIKGQTPDLTVTATYKNGRTKVISGWTSDFDTNLVGLQKVTVTYGSLTSSVMVNVISNTKLCPICGAEYELNEDGSDPGCPYCAEEVISISASPKVITVGINGTLDLTVTAAYRDSHEAVITDWYTNFTPDTTGTFNVTIFHKNQSDTIRVTVINHTITCPYCGLEYDYSDNPEGCPVCSMTLTGIKAALRNGGTKVTYGSELYIEIILIYRDMHTELTHTGWTVSGYQPDKEGEQTITVNYGGFSTSLMIEVVRNQFVVTCPICGTQYYLNDDGTDPGCPICTSGTNEDTAMIYFDITYSYEILDTLYKDGTYYFKDGDYFTVTVTAQGDSIDKKLRKILPCFHHRIEDMLKEQYTIGGEVTE